MWEELETKQVAFSRQRHSLCSNRKEEKPCVQWTDLWIWSKLQEPHLMTSLFFMKEEETSTQGLPFLGANPP